MKMGLQYHNDWGYKDWATAILKSLCYMKYISNVLFSGNKRKTLGPLTLTYYVINDQLRL